MNKRDAEILLSAARTMKANVHGAGSSKAMKANYQKLTSTLEEAGLVENGGSFTGESFGAHR